MNEQDKQILLKDLCARLPYEVKVDTLVNRPPRLLVGVFHTEPSYCIENGDGNTHWMLTGEFLPYLRPMSSMTEEEKKELNNYIFSEKGLRYFWFDEGIMYSGSDNQCFIGLGNDTIDKMVDWLNEHHFDYRGLIEKWLALHAPEGMYNTKIE